MPDPADPQSLNRYAYVNNNPVRYSDPSGHWAETLLDVGFIIYDIHDIRSHGLNWKNGAALVADVGCALLPIATGGGLLVRAATHADDAGKVAKIVEHADEAEEAIRIAGHLGDGVHAVLTASLLRKAGLHSEEGARFVKALAEQSTHGVGDRVVLGKWVKGGGYIAEAKRHGGIYFETAEGVWEALGKDPELAWAVNEQFLRNQLEAGVSRIEFVGETIAEIESAWGTFRWRELQFLKKHASQYGYELIGNAWVKVR